MIFYCVVCASLILVLVRVVKGDQGGAEEYCKAAVALEMTAPWEEACVKLVDDGMESFGAACSDSEHRYGNCSKEPAPLIARLMELST